MKPNNKVLGASRSLMREQDAPATMKLAAKPALTPKLRFPEFRDAEGWKPEKLGAVAALNTEKTGNKKCIPMSITSGVGLVSQQEKFGRVIAGDSFKNHLLLQKNDFAYNKSATKEFPQGLIVVISRFHVRSSYRVLSAADPPLEEHPIYNAPMLGAHKTLHRYFPKAADGLWKYREHRRSMRRR